MSGVDGTPTTEAAPRSPNGGRARISFLERRVVPYDGNPRAIRGWRLLAYLLWTHHVDQVDAARRPTTTPRARLRDQLGVAHVRSPIDELRDRMLEPVGALRLLIDDDRGMALRDAEALPCDLAELLAAIRAKDRAAARAIAGDETAVDRLAACIGRTRGTLDPRAAAWIGALVKTVSDFVLESNGAEPVLDAAVRRYLEAHLDRCGHVDLRDLHSPVDGVAKLPLEDVYVSLVVGPRGVAEIESDVAVTGHEDDDLAPPLDADAPGVDDLLVYEQPDGHTTIHFTELVREDRWCVILGEPGAGKTTLLHWLAFFHARAMLQPGVQRVEVRGERLGLDDVSIDLGPARLPVLVRIGEWAALAGDGPDATRALPELEDFLGRQTLREVALPGTEQERAALIAGALEEGRALILLDGLDEVDNKTLRQAIAERVERFVEAHVPDPARGPYLAAADEDDWGLRFSPPHEGGNQVIVSSRVHGYKQARLAGPFQLVRARRLDLPVAERFTRQWFLALEYTRAQRAGTSQEEATARAESQSARLIRAMRAHPNIRRLARNPLLITVLAAVQAQSGDDLPTTRAALYERAMRVLTERRTGAWTFERLVTAIGPFALWLQTNRPRGVATRAELEAQLAAGIARLEPADPATELAGFIEAAHRQSGVIVEYGNDRYGFPHASFREFLAATEVMRLDGSALGAWLDEHLHDPRWTEVVLLVLASADAVRPADADAALRHILDGSSPLEALLHHDLVVVGQALTEMAGGAAHVEPVVTALLEAAEDTHRRGVFSVESRVTNTLQQLIAARGEEAEAVVVDALADRGLARAAARVLSFGGTVSIGRLEALDLAARRAAGARVAAPARAKVAAALLEQGHELAPELHPVRDLWREGAPLEAAYRRLGDEASRLRSALSSVADAVKPEVHALVRSALASVDRAPAPLDEARTIERLVAESHALLPSLTGADVIDVAQLAFALDADGTRRELAEQVRDGRLEDVDSAAAFYETEPLALPAGAEIGAWLDAIEDERTVAALLGLRSRHLRTELLAVAWRQLGSATTPDLRRLALRALTAEAYEAGRLVTTQVALDAVLRLVAGDEDDRRLARTLASRLRLDTRWTDADLIERLYGLMAAPEPILARVAATLLASRPSAPLTAAQYDLVAAAITANDDLRPSAYAVLNSLRPSEAVPDAVLERTSYHFGERIAAGDIAAAMVHSAVPTQLRHAVATRLIEHLEAERPWWGGQPSAAAADELLAWAAGAGEQKAARAIEAVRWGLRTFTPIGLDLEALGGHCLERYGPGSRSAAAGLLACDAVLSGRMGVLDGFFERLAGVDGAAVVRAVQEAGHVLAAAVAPDVAGFAAIADAALARPAAGVVSDWQLAGARLVVDVQRHDREEVLVRFTERTRAGARAGALVYALDTDMVWPVSRRPDAALSGIQGIVPRRLGLVAEPLGRTRPGMDALVEVAGKALQSSEWTQRRAALFALDAAAGVNPAHFLRSARVAGLRSHVISAAQDVNSYSVRRTVISLLTRFREFDQPVVDTVLRAAQDQASVSSTMLERCETFQDMPELDVDALGEQLAGRNVQAVLAAATLLTAAGRTARVDQAGRERRRQAIEALVAVAGSADALLDSTAAPGGGTVRQALHDMLEQLVWEPPSRSGLDRAIARVAFARSWEAPLADTRFARASLPPGATVDVALRANTNRDWLGAGPPQLVVHGQPIEFAEELRDLPTLQLRLLARGTYNLLEMRTGVRLADLMTSSQLDEFEGFYNALDDAGAFGWLQTNFPNYREIVMAELIRILEEARVAAPTLRDTLEELAGEEGIGDLFADAVASAMPAALSGGALDEVLRLLSELAVYDLERALELLEKAAEQLAAAELADAKALTGEHTARLLRQAAARHVEQGEPAAAEALLRRALSSAAEAGEGRPGLSLVWNDLGRLSDRRGELAAAVECFLEAYKAAVRSHGPTSRDALSTAGNLAMAVACYDTEAGLEILDPAMFAPAADAADGPAPVHDRRAGLLRRAAELALAGDALERHRSELHRRLFAGLPVERFDAEGPIRRAEALLDRAEAELEHVDEAERREASWIAHARGRVASERRDVAAAEAFYARALEGKRKTLGAADPDLLVTLRSLAAARVQVDEDAGFELLADAAAELPTGEAAWQQVLGHLVWLLEDRGWKAERAGDLDRASALYTRAHALVASGVEVGPVRRGALHRDTADILLQRGQVAEAAAAYELALRETVSAFGSHDHEPVLDIFASLLSAILAASGPAAALARIDALAAAEPALAPKLEQFRAQVLSPGE
jgi:tetratricopeptide (TPR) repeat protein